MTFRGGVAVAWLDEATAQSIRPSTKGHASECHGSSVHGQSDGADQRSSGAGVTRPSTPTASGRSFI
jgi:hypothetical protein